MNITPRDINTFLVEASSSEDMVYLVDLDENDGMGACSCPDFEYRGERWIRYGEHSPCKHIIACRKLNEKIKGKK